jgi:photosystem II stability/assembly factor-like uncharacterized protein
VDAARGRGATWSRTLIGQASALEIDASNFNDQYAAIADQRLGVVSDTPNAATNGLYRSTDAGQTWAFVSGPWGSIMSTTESTVGRIELAMAPSNPNVLYASIAVPPNQGTSARPLLGLWRTDNAWATTPSWVKIPTDALGSATYCGADKCNYTHVISVDPDNQTELIAAGERIWRCANCSTSPTWTNIQSACAHSDNHVLLWTGRRLVDGNDGGVWSTSNFGATWQNHNSTFVASTFYSGALHPTDPNVILGGVRDSPPILRQGLRWLVLPQSTLTHWGEAEVAVSSSHPDTDWMIGEVGGGIQRTTDGGLSSVRADAGIDHSDAAFVPPVRKCPHDDNVFLTGSTRLWRTNNFFNSAAPTWTANGPTSTFRILSIAYAPSEGGCNTYAYGNYAGQIRLTRDGGASWADLDPAGVLPGRTVNALAFDPATPNVLYAGFSNFDDRTPGKPGHVFKSTNALAATPSWTNISPPVDVPFDAIAVDPRNTQLVYAGSDTGLWHSTNGGATWIRDDMSVGLPNVSIYDIQINPVTNRTVVFTHDRSAYVLTPSR